MDLLLRKKYIRRIDLQADRVTAHGQRVRLGEPQTSLGEWDVRGTELDPGVSFAE
jgi:hypothetical protein